MAEREQWPRPIINARQGNRQSQSSKADQLRTLDGCAAASSSPPHSANVVRLGAPAGGHERLPVPAHPGVVPSTAVSNTSATGDQPSSSSP